MVCPVGCRHAPAAHDPVLISMGSVCYKVALVLLRPYCRCRSPAVQSPLLMSVICLATMLSSELPLPPPTCSLKRCLRVTSYVVVWLVLVKGG